MPRLTDPWFDAEFYGRVESGGFTLQGCAIEGAQGLVLWCPCGHGKPEFPLDGARPHAILVPFANPRNASPCPSDHGPMSDSGARPRWQMSGAGLEDLTVTPSILVQPKRPCWHGFITNGEIQ